jgi:4-amino-4-deoxy-L-arabinose transferase-like glycosyltransferase
MVDSVVQSRHPGELMNRTGLRVALLVAGLAITSRLVLLVWLPMAPLADIAKSGDGDTRYYVRLAQKLTSSGEYVSGHLRAYSPPGFPLFLAGLSALGADSRGLQLAQNLMYLLAVLMLAALGVRSRGPLAGTLAALLALTSPLWLLLPQRALSETLFVVLVAAGTSIALGRTTPPTLPLALLAGMVFGLAALVRETGLLLGTVLGVVAGSWAWRSGGSIARGVLLAAIVVAGAILAILPWTIRNYHVFHQVVPIATNGPINLYMGNNPEATGVYSWRLPPEAQAAWNRPDEGRSNELFASQLAGREAIAYIRANPSKTLALVPTKLWALWGPPVALRGGLGLGSVLRSGVAVFWTVCLALAVYGLWRLRWEPISWFVFGSSLTITAVHAATYGDPRYRAVCEYLLMLPAGLGAADLWRSSRVDHVED